MLRKIIICILIPATMLLEGCGYASEKFVFGEDRHVGGDCEGCEGTLEFDHAQLHSTDTLPGAGVDAPYFKIIGTVYEADGETPAENIIIYIHHTDQDGHYTVRNEEQNTLSLNSRNKGVWAIRHGSLRGWSRTDANGTYSFVTQRPASYPGRSDPAHIHMFIKEPRVAPYYIDDIVFADDDLLTEEYIATREERGGPGITRPYMEGDVLVVKRDIVLGMNVPGY